MNFTKDYLLQAKSAILDILKASQTELMGSYGFAEHHLKEDKSVVTGLDLLVEQRLKAGLAKFDNSIGFAGEEGEANYNQKIFWLVDPIDGSEHFIRGVPFVTSMVALIENGTPILGVINRFAVNECYWAIKNEGAFCNEAPIHVSERSLDRALIEIETDMNNQDCRDKLFQAYSRARGFVNFYASGMTYAMIASGKFEARINNKSWAQPWDHAPGALIIQEAGGRVANLGSDRYDYQNLDFIAANPQVFDELMKIFSAVAR